MQVDKTGSGVTCPFFHPKELAALTPPMGGVRGESWGSQEKGSQRSAQEHPGEIEIITMMISR